MSDRLLLFLALRDGVPIAGALNLIGGDTLYGRYWGTIDEVPNLHFELCYYQAIEWAIANGLTHVQAGAQGEHKLARGYEPVTHDLSAFHRRPELSPRGRAIPDRRAAGDRRRDGLAARRLALSHVLVGVDRDASALGVRNAAIHCASGEAPGSLARRRNGDQAALAAQFLDVLKHAVERLLKAFAGQPDRARRAGGRATARMKYSPDPVAETAAARSSA